MVVDTVDIQRHEAPICYTSLAPILLSAPRPGWITRFHLAITPKVKRPQVSVSFRQLRNYQAAAQPEALLLVCDIVLGGTAPQNGLPNSELPPSFTARSPQGVQIAYAVTPTISGLSDPFKGEVHPAFSCATRVIWLVMIWLSGAGLFPALLMPPGGRPS